MLVTIYVVIMPGIIRLIILVASWLSPVSSSAVGVGGQKASPDESNVHKLLAMKGG